MENKIIDLKDCKPYKEYEIVVTCDEPRFFEIGLFPTQKIKMISHHGKLYKIQIENSQWAIREEQGNCIKVKEI